MCLHPMKTDLKCRICLENLKWLEEELNLPPSRPWLRLWKRMRRMTQPLTLKTHAKPRWKRKV